MAALKEKVHEIIYEADTPAGKAFDIALFWAIGLSILTVCLDSVASINAEYGELLFIAEWIFTILFTIEYLLRIYSISKPSHYIFSFFGIVDLLATLPTYLSLLFPNTQYLLVIRILRIMRVFRVLKLARFIGEANARGKALRASRHKIIVFLGGVFTVVVIAGALMHLIEGPEAGFTSIPKGIYWTIVTITTVGYGDISPQTPLGQFLSSILMICAYGIIAVPTGIVSVELSKGTGAHKEVSNSACRGCGKEGHAGDAVYCKYCGEKLV